MLSKVIEIYYDQNTNQSTKVQLGRVGRGRQIRFILCNSEYERFPIRDIFFIFLIMLKPIHPFIFLYINLLSIHPLKNNNKIGVIKKDG